MDEVQQRRRQGGASPKHRRQRQGRQPAQTAREEQTTREEQVAREATIAREEQSAREATAREARKIAARRRARQSGLAGWVSDRASRWTLDGTDWEFLESQKYVWNPLLDYWFRMEIEGWDVLPEPPALLIGIHSGGPFPWDAWTVGIQWWRHFGRERPLYGTAHDALMATPVIGSYFRRMGVIPAAPDSITAALAAGRDVALWPGGERDSLRPWSRRDEAILAGRTGFVKLAIRSGVPIVPISTVGGPDAMPVLATGQRLAKLLRLDKFARLKMFPIALQAPWGLSPALLPELPLPTKIRTAFGEPIELDPDPARAEDEEYVRERYEAVRTTIQAGMDRLARRRRLPLFG